MKFFLEKYVENFAVKFSGKTAGTIVGKFVLGKYTVYSLQCTLYSKVVLLSVPQFWEWKLAPD